MAFNSLSWNHWFNERLSVYPWDWPLPISIVIRNMSENSVRIFSQVVELLRKISTAIPQESARKSAMANWHQILQTCFWWKTISDKNKIKPYIPCLLLWQCFSGLRFFSYTRPPPMTSCPMWINAGYMCLHIIAGGRVYGVQWGTREALHWECKGKWVCRFFFIFLFYFSECIFIFL